MEPPRDSAETLAERAVAHGDEHAIKLAEACLARNEVRPDPAYLAAIESALPAAAGDSLTRSRGR